MAKILLERVCIMVFEPLKQKYDEFTVEYLHLDIFKSTEQY